MELIDIYNQISNRINDPQVIEKLIIAYSQTKEFKDDFYGKLAKANHKNNSGKYNVADNDYFYAMMFNTWKNSIVNMSKEQYIALHQRGKYGQDFIKLRNFLKSVSDVKTAQQARDISYNKYNDPELEAAFEKYRWTALGEDSGWVHVSSRYVQAQQNQYVNVEHRLYISNDLLDTYKMISLFVEKCQKYQLPYYFKFDEFGHRDDNIVIYSSTELIGKYIDILNEIKKENPDLISRAKELPLLTGRIYNWLGYGSEPEKDANGNFQSFNEIRAKAIEPAIAQTNTNWILSHLNSTITYNNQPTLFYDYITQRVMALFIKELADNLTTNEKWEREKAQKNGTAFDYRTVIAKMGYSLADLQSTIFRKNLYNIVQRKVLADLPRLNQGSFNDLQKLDITIGNGKTISLSVIIFREVIVSLPPLIMKHDPNFITAVHKAIINNSRKAGIDVDNYSFDVRVTNMIKQTAREKVAAQQPKPKDKSFEPRSRTVVSDAQQPTNLSEASNSIAYSEEQSANIGMTDEEIEAAKANINEFGVIGSSSHH